jgi:predicted YcjX-like family ATPase
MKTLRIGITGLSRAGKTVFLTSLINQLLNGGEEALKAFLDQGVTIGAREAHQPAHTSWLSYETYLNKIPFFSSPHQQVSQFPYEEYLDAFRRDSPQWPVPTTSLSRFSLYVTLQRETSTQDLLLELVDYPGERLLDAPLLGQTFEQWAADTVKEAMLGLRRDLSVSWLQACDALVANGATNEQAITAAIDEYRKYLKMCHKHGLTFLQPSAFLLEGEDTKNLDLLFCPLPLQVQQYAGEITQQFTERYQRYQEQLVKPFCQEVTECDRQVVLVDVLRVLKQGVHCFNDTRKALLKILAVYGYTPESSKWSPWTWLGLNQTASRVVFIATKADQASREEEAFRHRLLRVQEEADGEPRES